MLDIATFISILMVLGFALFQFSLVLGAPLGEFTLGGNYKVLPLKMRLVSGGFSGIFIFVGLSYMQRTGTLNIGFNNTFINVLLIVYTLFLAYAIIANGFLTKSKKERYLMTPCSIIGFICSVFVLLNT